MKLFSMSLDGLTLVEGISHEGILRKLSDEGINHRVFFPPRSDNGYFRGSTIEVDETKESETKRILGVGRRVGSFPHQFYYGQYQIDDISSFRDFSGKFKLRDGKLIERTSVRYINERDVKIKIS